MGIHAGRSCWLTYRYRMDCSRLVKPTLTALLLVATGCSFESPQVPPTTSHVVEAAVDHAAEAAVVNWVNMTGLWSEADLWSIRLAELCETDPWEHETAERYAEQYLTEDGGSVDRLKDASTTVWLNAITACRDRFPPEAIEKGPPGLGG
ncbi:MAG: hypothetical protein MAG471_00845 [Acidimicrobiaceae bacterium]|nr:hypothetical protein [Acidimicrobiaceae bacterium]